MIWKFEGSGHSTNDFSEIAMRMQILTLRMKLGEISPDDVEITMTLTEFNKLFNIFPNQKLFNKSKKTRTTTQKPDQKPQPTGEPFDATSNKSPNRD